MIEKQKLLDDRKISMVPSHLSPKSIPTNHFYIENVNNDVGNGEFWKSMLEK
jgi:hypothetical protein